jgi:hypothetical protein
MDHNGFNMVLGYIKEDPVFRSNSRNPQAPVEYQLMFALARSGHYGNGMSVHSVAQTFRIAGQYALLILISFHDC